MRDLGPNDPSAIGPCRLVAELGRGGMGRVILGVEGADRLVAVKLVLDEFLNDPDFRSRFEREVAASGRVTGLYTARLLGADAAAWPPWLATEFVDGPTLASVVNRRGPLDAALARRLGTFLVAALADIHAAGLVHRDLTPSNIMFTDGDVAVIDFGIARVMTGDDGSLTGSKYVIGKMGYHSPEQLDRRPITGASDVFTLGTLLAEITSGTNPFAYGADYELMRNIATQPPNLEGVPGELRSLVERCLAKDPDDRPGLYQLRAELGAPPQDGLLWPDVIRGMIYEGRIAITRTLRDKGFPEAADAEERRAEQMRRTRVWPTGRTKPDPNAWTPPPPGTPGGFPPSSSKVSDTWNAHEFSDFAPPSSDAGGPSDGPPPSSDSGGASDFPPFSFDSTGSESVSPPRRSTPPPSSGGSSGHVPPRRSSSPPSPSSGVPVTTTPAWVAAVAVFVVIMLVVWVASDGTGNDSADDPKEKTSTTRTFSPSPSPSRTTWSPSPDPKVFPDAEVGDCVYNAGSNDSIRLKFTRCDTGVFEIVNIRSESRKKSCWDSSKVDWVVSNKGADMALCMMYHHKSSAYRAGVGDCVFRWSKDGPWTKESCEIGVFTVIQRLTDEDDLDACKDSYLLDWKVSLTSSAANGLDRVLCLSINYPDDIGHAPMDTCMLMTERGGSQHFRFSDCNRANTIVTGRTSNPDNVAFCGNHGSVGWTSNYFPELSYRVCWNWY